MSKRHGITARMVQTRWSFEQTVLLSQYMTNVARREKMGARLWPNKWNNSTTRSGVGDEGSRVYLISDYENMQRANRRRKCICISEMIGSLAKQVEEFWKSRMETGIKTIWLTILAQNYINFYPVGISVNSKCLNGVSDLCMNRNQNLQMAV